ncbi:MAG: ECF transporter S component [Bacilli bacterium]|nr:ECF transporter S component [Bacilli bacterium]
MGNFMIRRIVYDGMLAAIYVVLSTLGIHFGNVLTVTFASLPTTLAALIFGPTDAFLIGLLGEFLAQYMKYGITLTTPIWILPPAIRGLLIGLVALLFKKKGKDMMDNKFGALGILMGVAIVTSLVNTLAMFVDATVYQYSFVFAAWSTLTRFGTSLLTAVLVWLVCIPLYGAIKKILPKQFKEQKP